MFVVINQYEVGFVKQVERLIWCINRLNVFIFLKCFGFYMIKLLTHEVDVLLLGLHDLRFMIHKDHSGGSALSEEQSRQEEHEIALTVAGWHLPQHSRPVLVESL